MDAQALKGHLVLLLLTVLVDGPLHGYRIIESLRARSGGVLDLAEGTVYPALHRLERAEWLASTWQVVDGRRRRMYRLTPKGEAEVQVQRAEWTRFSSAVSRVLGGI
jgi:DNA-binding PadR family transcriptional regulator